MSTEAETKLWGGETDKAIDNFPVSGHPVPVPVVRSLGRIKAAAARVNAELGKLDAEVAERIAAAGDAVAGGEHDDQFPVDVFQTGSGTSSNMNANEVIAALAGEDVHPNDHVNMGQSSNDVFPSAVHLAALDELVNDLLPSLRRLADSLAAKAVEFDDIVKSGRTHMMDAVPVTLGQEFRGYEAQVRQGIARVEATLGRVGQIPLGGTAVGTGINGHPEFAAAVCRILQHQTGLAFVEARNHFEAQAGRWEELRWSLERLAARWPWRPPAPAHRALGGQTPDLGSAAEVTVEHTAVSAELSSGGLRINFVPRDGGNTFSTSAAIATSVRSQTRSQRPRRVCVPTPSEQAFARRGRMKVCG